MIFCILKPESFRHVLSGNAILPHKIPYHIPYSRVVYEVHTQHTTNRTIYCCCAANCDSFKPGIESARPDFFAPVREVQFYIIFNHFLVMSQDIFFVFDCFTSYVFFSFMFRFPLASLVSSRIPGSIVPYAMYES